MGEYRLILEESDYGDRITIKFSSKHNDYPGEEHFIYLDWLEKYGVQKCVEDCVNSLGCAIKEHLHCKCHMDDEKTDALIDTLVLDIKRKVKNV
jgi:hypothetical protein